MRFLFSFTSLRLHMNTKIQKIFELEEPIGKVWASLSNPEDIVTCVPGAQITDKIDDRNYKGEVTIKFGPIKASYTGDIEIVELDETNHKMVLKGKGLDSKGKGSADMIMNGILAEEGGKTQVTYDMDITIIGMLAQYGSRLINDVSDQLLNQFVVNFKQKLGAEEGAEGAGAATADAAESDNALDASSLIGTVFKSIFSSIADFFKSLFGGKKNE